MSCSICGAEPCINPSFCRTCREADVRHRREPGAERHLRLLADSISLDRAWSEINDPRNRPTPQVTIEAIIIDVRERGMQVLGEPANQKRLSRCDAAALAEIKRRLAK
jgi:hypothetical protein